MDNTYITPEQQLKRMRQIMPDWKVAEITGLSDEVYGEMDPESGIHSKGDTEVEYSEEEDPGLFV